MDMSQVLQELNQRFGLGAGLEVRVDDDEPYTVYIESPHYLRAGATAKEAFLKSAEVWLYANRHDHTATTQGLELLVERVKGEGGEHGHAMRHEGADNRDMRG